MKPVDNERFKNEVSRRFYNYFYEKIKAGDIDADSFYSDFAPNFGQNRSVFLSGLKTGQRGVTIEQIDIAHKNYKVSPNFLFGLSDIAIDNSLTVVQEDEGVILNLYDKSIGEKIKDIFQRHKTNVKQYAETRLQMSEQNLHKIMRGDGRLYFDIAIKICEDHGESLDLFRRVPIPMGHYLAQIRMQDEIIEGLKRELQTKK